MKTAQDPRHKQRIAIFKSLFAESFTTQAHKPAQTKDILDQLKQIDQIIARAAPDWPLEKVAKVDLAILRLAVYELLIKPKEPPRVVIDEAVEIAKEFGGRRSGPFINGVLGTIIKKV